MACARALFGRRVDKIQKEASHPLVTCFLLAVCLQPSHESRGAMILRSFALPPCVKRHWRPLRRHLQSSSGQLTSKLRRCHDASDVVSLIRSAEDSKLLDGILWTAAMQRMSALEKKQSKQMTEGWKLLIGMAGTYLPCIGHRELAVVAVAIAKSKWDTSSRRCFLNDVIQVALVSDIGRGGTFSVRHLANLSWAAAATSVAAPELFKAAANAVAQSPRQSNSRDISQLLWAFGRSSNARLGVDVLDNFAGSQQPLSAFNDHDMAATVWAAATLATQRALTQKGRNFIRELTAHAAERSSEFSPQGLSMLFWATATLASKGVDMSDAALTSACAPAIIGSASKFTPQGAANILWSLSTLARMEQDAGREVTMLEDVSVRHLLLRVTTCQNIRVAACRSC